ncbi:MAG: hypothetical protein RLZZ324_388 [Candidatus Parcubacteria bacterium]
MKVKCRLQASDVRTFGKEREIWWVHLGENLGSEQNGKHDSFERPALIIRRFSADHLWILPISTTLREHGHFVPISHGKSDQVPKVILSQIRTISCKRLIRKQRMLPEAEFAAIMGTLRGMLS